MSRRNKGRKSIKSITKLNKSKNKKTKALKKKPLSNSTNNKKPSSGDDTNGKKCNSNASNVSVKRVSLICRRYEEFHEKFLNYDKILNFLGRTQKANPGAVDLVKIGNSTQGKPIYMALITTSVCSANNPKMAALIVAGLNGENAFAVSNALYMIEYLTKNQNSIKIMDYYIIPCCNPDAYDEFIKSKENDDDKSNNKNYCDLSKKKSQMDISKSEKKDVKEPCKNSPKSDKKDPQKPHCDTPKYEKSCKRMRCEESTNDRIDKKVPYETDKKHSNLSINSKRKNTQRNEINKESLKSKSNKNCEKNSNSKTEQNKSKTQIKIEHANLILNFPVILGLNDMRRIPTELFLEKIKIWKENYKSQCPETRALINVIYTYQFAIRLLISLQEDGESICYPYGFCAAISDETNDLMEVAKKGKCGITGRNFQYGSIYDIQGLTYGSLIDFLKVDKASIKFTYVIQVHKKTPRYNEKGELKQIMRYGGEIMEGVKRMSCAVYKSFTNMTGNKEVETESTKPILDKKSSC